MKKLKLMTILLIALCLSTSLMLAACDETPDSGSSGSLPTLSSIEIKSLPDKTEYYVGEELDLAGATITVRYSDGSSLDKAIAAEMVSGYNKDVAGAQTLSVRYSEDGNERMTTLIVEVKAIPIILSSIEIKSQPAKTEYYVGEELDLAGAKITVRYSDDNSVDKAITVDMISGYDKNVVGAQVLTVTYSEDGIEKTATLSVVVNSIPVTLSSIEIKSQPDKTEYYVDDELDLTGAKITVKYSDGSSVDKAITADMVSGYDKTSVGTQVLTVTYSEGDVEKTTTLSVVVAEQPDYLFTYGDEYCWNITEDDGVVSFESLSNSQYLMFNKLRFSGGSISFDLKVSDNDYTYSVLSGIVFAADVLDVNHDNGRFYVVGRDKWNELLVFSKDNGEFAWQDTGKVSNVLTDTDKSYRIKMVWDKDVDKVYYFIDDVYQGTGILNKGFSGEYLGIYADNAGVTISDIVIDEDEEFVPPVSETDDYLFTCGDSSNWSITGEGETASYVALKDSQYLMFKNKTFGGGSVSFKIKFNNKNYTYWCASGILFGADTLQAEHNTGKFYVAGVETWNDFVVFAKDNGNFQWLDSNKAAGVINEIDRTYNLKFIWDSENDLLHYFVDGSYISTQALTPGYKGQYMGLYTENVGMVISDIVIDEEEVFSTPVAVKETDDYMFTIGDASNWEITEDNGSVSYRSIKANQMLMLKNKTFEGGSVSFKIKVACDNFTYSIASGIVFAADRLDVDYDQGSYYVAGADKWYDYVAFSKNNGVFAWQDTGKITNVVTEWGKTYDLKFVWDKTADCIHYFVNGEYKGTGTLSGSLGGSYIGIYADNAGVTISDIVIAPDEVYIA